MHAIDVTKTTSSFNFCLYWSNPLFRALASYPSFVIIKVVYSRRLKQYGNAKLQPSFKSPCNCNLFTHKAPRSSQKLVQECPCFPDRTGIWPWHFVVFIFTGIVFKCWSVSLCVLRRSITFTGPLIRCVVVALFQTRKQTRRWDSESQRNANGLFRTYNYYLCWMVYCL